MRSIIIAALSLTLIGAGSCKKLNDTINKVGTYGSLSATIDGKEYNSPSTTISFGDSALWLSGRDFASDEKLTISILNYDKAISKYIIKSFDNSIDYTGDKGNLRSETGVFEIQSTGEKSAKGTFSCESKDGKKITNGSFDVRWD